MRTEVLHYLTLLTTCITIITVIARISSSVINKLVMIQRKLDALKGVVQIMITHLDSINVFLVKYHGLSDHASTKDLVQSFIEQYNKSDTNF